VPVIKEAEIVVIRATNRTEQPARGKLFRKILLIVFRSFRPEACAIRSMEDQLRPASENVR
jgi:hypothetical protein